MNIQQPGRNEFRGSVLPYAAAAFFALWFFLNYSQLTADPDSRTRVIVGLAYFVLIFRRKQHPHFKTTKIPVRRQLLLGILGTVLAVCGIVTVVHQLEWLGLMLMLYASLRNSLDTQYAGNISAALFVLYWIHPLPGQIFGPLQIFMQRMSVIGSESILMCTNTAVWADGMILRTGLQDFEVPTMCSGMKTAVTVFMCGLGAGLLYRFKWRHILTLIIIGLMQVLALNILRICFMILYASKRPSALTTTYLHDSAGIFLLAAIVLIHIEAAAWRRWLRGWYKRAQSSAQQAGQQNFFSLTQGLRIFPVRYALIALAAVIATLSIVLIIYKNRPTKRAILLSRVVESLILSDLPSAERASAEVLLLAPENTENRLTHARILLLRSKFERALSELKLIPQESRDNQFLIMNYWGLISTGRKNEASLLLADLPAERRDYPGIAIAVAESAASENDHMTVAKHLPKAAEWPMLMKRVRALFPYLASTGHWKTISDCDTEDTYVNPDNLIIGITAHIYSNRRNRAERLLRKHSLLWKGDSRYLKHILFLSDKEDSPNWKLEFFSLFTECLDTLSTDDICSYLGHIIKMNNLELAQQAYIRLKSADPTHPYLSWIPLEFPDAGFHHNRMPDITAETAQDRKELLESCLTECRKRDAQNELTYQMSILFSKALDMNGETTKAHRHLEATAASYPARMNEILLLRAELYDKNNNAQMTYELMREGQIKNMASSAALDSVMIHTLLRLDFGVYALKMGLDTRRQYPLSPEAVRALSDVLAYFGRTEEALFALRQYDPDMTSPMTARLLEATGRTEKAKQMKLVLGIGDDAAKKSKQWMIPRAESSVTWFKVPTPSDKEIQKITAELKSRINTDTSPFVRALHKASFNWIQAKGKGGSSDIARWKSLGRDDNEKTVALHKLAMMHARRDDRKSALKAVREGIRLMPDSSVLWQMNVALSEGNTDIVMQARKACPENPEIWLAALVTASSGELGSNFDHVSFVNEAIKENSFPPATFVRAGEYLLRTGHEHAANIAASHAIKDPDKFLPAYVLGMRCAAALNDKQRAIHCALLAADMAPDPWPFRKAIAELNMLENSYDTGQLNRLKALSIFFSKEPSWTARLGKAHFNRGELKDAGKIFAELTAEHEKDMDVGSLLLAAEYRRRSGDHIESLRLLSNADERFPNNPHVVNNLVFTLAQKEETRTKAIALIPSLLELGNSSAIYDTVSTAFDLSGDSEQAKIYKRKATEQKKAEADTVKWR